jgi:Tol biopolymer transport system component
MTGPPHREVARLLSIGAVVLATAASAGAAGSPWQPVIGNDSPSWSPDGRQIAFTSFRNGFGDIYVIGVDGRGERRLTTHASHDDHPAWSPDGTRIAFVANRNGNPDIYVMNADGTGQRRVTTSPGREYYPGWSPDGSRLVFQSDRDDRPNVYTIDVDGTREERLTTGAFSAQRPTWSAAGKIAFSSNREGTFKLFVMDADGSGLRRLTSATGFVAEYDPRWSPDGTRIAYSRTGDPPIGNTEIYVANADGSQATRITSYWTRDVDPAWSPEGRSIAFTRGPSAFRPEVHVMAADGRALRQLTASAVRFKVAEMTRTPARPVAGRYFTLRAIITEPTDDVVEQGTVACPASVGGQRLPVAVRRFTIPSLVTCTWNVPATARGKVLTFGFDVRARRSGAARTLKLLVR